MYELSIVDVLLRIVLTMALCGAIGYEREYRRKPAGLRTLILVGLGTAIIAIGAIQIATADGTTIEFDRLIAGILPGIGFLGAGTIIQSRGNVVGLTTAASIWVVAGIGLACGFGLYLLSIMTTVLALATLVVLPANVAEEGVSRKGR
jgi:putative Mg2+ transporter-C (MgtC) family protein